MLGIMCPQIMICAFYSDILGRLQIFQDQWKDVDFLKHCVRKLYIQKEFLNL